MGDSMLAAFREMAMPLGRRARAAVWPAFARQYRNDPSGASQLALKVLGIADASFRPNFAALANALDRTAHLNGDIIECGVFRGSTLLGMAHRLALLGRRDATLFGCDSFQGFPAPSREDALQDGSFHERTQEGIFSDTSYEALRSRIAALGYAQNIQLVKGFFNETLGQFAATKFRVAHLDCDLYQSYVTCLELLYPRLVPGGYMVFDEYDTSESVYPGARKAIDEFLAGIPERLQRLGTSSDARWFIVKG